MLLEMHCDALAEAGIDLRGDVVLRDREIKLLGHGTGHRDHGHLAFPGLADPALLGELLHETGALAGGIGPVQTEPAVAGQARDHHHQENNEYFCHWSVQPAALCNTANDRSPRQRLCLAPGQPVELGAVY
jgi:hypothetical protein